MRTKANIKNLFLGILLTIFVLSTFTSISLAEGEEQILAVYITGIGCPNCAVTDPAILIEYTKQYPNLIIFEYEIYTLRASNQQIAQDYFDSYLTGSVQGVPLVIFNKENVGIGRFQVLDANLVIESLESNNFPQKNGTSVNFEDLDLTILPGKINIWTKDRVLTSGSGGNNALLKELLVTENISLFVENQNLKEVTPIPIMLSGSKVEFEKAASLDGWTVQWHDTGANVTNEISHVEEGSWKSEYWLIILFGLFALLFLMYKFKMIDKRLCLTLTETQKNYFIVGISVLVLIGFFILAKNVSPDVLEKMGYSLPLPVFTLIIGLLDGFNPCNMFVLTFLLGLLISASHSRKKILIIGFVFVLVVFIFYFLFMVAWLNVFKYIGFITPLRIGIALLALVAGFINCKELLAFKKGITLMIPDKYILPLKKKMEDIKRIIVSGSSVPALVAASASLAIFSSLVELPCTAGFPIIYTGILTGKGLASTLSYYMYLVLYNILYVTPLIAIISVFGYTMKGERITKRQMQIIKFIGGMIMILLGLILLINPGLIGLGI